MKKHLLLPVVFGLLGLIPAAATDVMTFDENDVVTINVDKTTGRFTRANNAGTYGNEYTSNNDYPGFKIAITSSGNNNMNWSGNNLNIWSGGDAGSTYRFSSLSEDYYVSGFSFTATKSNESTTITLSEALQEFVTVTDNNYVATAIAEGTDVDIVVAKNNNPVTLTDFTVTLTPKEDPALPASSGWYIIRPQATGNLTAMANHYVATTNDEFRTTTGGVGSYALKYIAEIPEDMPASVFTHINVSGSTYQVTTINGHMVRSDGRSKYPEGNNSDNTAFVVADADSKTVKIGGFWAYHNPNNCTEKPLLGQSGSASNNSFKVTKAHPQLRYDIWNVVITGGEKAGKNTSLHLDTYLDTRIELTNAANKSIAKVFDGGYFFVDKGTVLSNADFTYGEIEGKQAVIEVNNENHTVTLIYCTKESAIADSKAQIDAIYATYLNEALLDSAVINNIVKSIYEAIETAAGEDDNLSDVEYNAISAIVAAEPTAEHHSLIANSVSSAAGKLVYFKNWQYENSFLTTGNISNTDTNQRLTSSTTKTVFGSLWEVLTADAEAGTFYLRNYGNGLYMGNVAARETNVPMTDNIEEAHPFILEYAKTTDGHSGFGIKDTTENGLRYMHSKGLNDRCVKWNAPSGSYASGWSSSRVDAVEAPYAFSVENSSHVITFEGVALHDGVTYGDHHAIIINKIQYDDEEAGEQPARVRASKQYSYVDPTEPTIVKVPEAEHAADGKVVIPLGTVLPEGDYEVKVPSAIFMVGDKHSMSSVSTIKVDKDGGVTGLDDVVAAPAGAVVEGIYDLQGRKLAQPVKGINIINGRKVLVK